MKKLLGTVIGLGFAIVLIGSAVLAFKIWIEPCATAELRSQHAEKTIMIPRGTSLAKLTSLLENEGFIKNKMLFHYAAMAFGLSSTIQAGEFSLPTQQSIFLFIRTLQTSKPITHRVVIPEGNNIFQIAKILAEKKLIPSEEEFIRYVSDASVVARYSLSGTRAQSLEGYLFPNTYQFTRLDDVAKIVQTMVGEFRKRFLPEWEERARELGFTAHEIVILASVIEKETGVGQERPVIASAFHNRLKKGMKLQSDPTTIYGIKNFNGNLTRKDLEEWTPYNTYRIRGLPVGPIANPGTDSIRAALYPQKTNFIYFVSRNDGTHHFSVSLKEHNRAVTHFQRRRNIGGALPR